MAKEKLSDKVKRLEALIQEKEQQLKLAIDVIDEQADKIAKDVKTDIINFGWGDAAIFVAGALIGGLLVWIF